MILILSDSSDFSTTKVIEWLVFLKKEYVRINVQDKIEFEFLGSDILLKTNYLSIKISEIKSFWYRRGYFNFKYQYPSSIPQFNSLQQIELNNILDYIYYKLSKLKHINTIQSADVNKLIVNDYARELGIKTPDDFIFSNLDNLKEELKKIDKKIITKLISGRCTHEFDDYMVYNYTKEINVSKIRANFFLPSLVQNKIDKKYEVRAFYLEGNFSCMAIFSQKDKQTNVDFRNYNDDKPNRTVPFKLPNRVEIQIDMLMKKLDLNCGSIDVIVTQKNEFVFLEINPVGQFGMVSYTCNYFLEKKIAEYL
jgi:ATP-GRASP peptide maturase of grasp-with-spasm system